MRTLICLIVLLLQVKAYSHNCPEYIKENPTAMKSLEFLKKFKGQYTLGKCSVEISVCDGFEETAVHVPIAEIMLVDQYGREIYTSITYPETQTWYFETKTKLNKRMINYNKWDRYYEEELGRTEHHQIEILTDWNNLNEINSIHVGIYSTNNQLNQPNGNDSTWSICEK